MSSVDLTVLARESFFENFVFAITSSSFDLEGRGWVRSNRKRDARPVEPDLDSEMKCVLRQSFSALCSYNITRIKPTTT